MRAFELMGIPVVTVAADATAKQAAQTLVENDITAAPVIDENGRLVGIVSEADLIRGEIPPDARRRLISLTDPATPVSALVAEVMTREVVTVPPFADAADIAELMLRVGIKSVPVVEDNAPVGMVSRRDLLATVARDNESIAAEVTARLTAHSNRSWSVAVADGVVTLGGDTTLEEFHRARLLAGTVAGVRRVHPGPAHPVHPGLTDDTDQQRDDSERFEDRGSESHERRPRLRLASAVMFVRELERSTRFYRELLALEVAVSDNTAALLVSPDGFQLYLRSKGPRAHQPLGHIGIQYLIWTADGEDDLRRCEQVLRAHSEQVSTETTDGFTVVEGRGPDDVHILITYPGPDQAPRQRMLRRIYQW